MIYAGASAAADLCARITHDFKARSQWRSTEKALRRCQLGRSEMSIGTSAISRMKLRRSGTEHVAPLEIVKGLAVFAINIPPLVGPAWMQQTDVEHHRLTASISRSYHPLISTQRGGFAGATASAIDFSIRPRSLLVERTAVVSFSKAARITSRLRRNE
jgi:hypothetical protein